MAENVVDAPGDLLAKARYVWAGGVEVWVEGCVVEVEEVGEHTMWAGGAVGRGSRFVGLDTCRSGEGDILEVI